MTDYAFFDSGDIELCIGSSQLALEAIEERARTILADGKLPFMLGGEHLVTLGAFRAAAEKYPDIHIIHFDAHADLREDYLDVKLSPRLRYPPVLGDCRGREDFSVWHPLRRPGGVCLGPGPCNYPEI